MITTSRTILSILFTLNVSMAFSQYLGYEKINDADIKRWIPKLEIKYFGTYQFGDSEAESTLILFSSGTEIIAQIKSGTWNSDATDWIWIFDNLTNVKIDKNGQFYSDEYRGEFAIYNGSGEQQKCLKIFDSWSGATAKEGEYELGLKTGDVNSMYPGKYPQASLQPLDQKELNKMSSEELQIMRNEIFARYGYKFQEGGEMDKYFRSQRWYRPQHSDVTNFLTTLEKSNIERIQQEEKRP